MDSITAFWQQSAGVTLSSFYSINQVQSFSGDVMSGTSLTINFSESSAAYLVSIFSIGVFSSSSSVSIYALSQRSFECLITVQTAMTDIYIPLNNPASASSSSAIIVFRVSNTSNAFTFAYNSDTTINPYKLHIAGFIACLS